MNKFNISKALLDTVSGIVTTAKKQQVEQNTQFVSAMKQKTKIETIRPLTAEQLADIPKREAKDLDLHRAIRQIATASATEASAEQQTAEGRINSMYRTSGGRGRSLSEGKAHTVPKTAKEKDLAALAEPKGKITHKDVMVGRGVIAKEEVEQADEAMSPQAATTMKHVEKSSASATVKNAIKKASKDIKPGVQGYRDRAAALNAAGIQREEVESVEEGWEDMLKDVKKRAEPQPNGGSGMKKGTRYGGSNQKDEKGEKGEKKEANEGMMATVKKYAKKALDKVGHGSDEDMIKDLQKKMGMPQTGKKPVKEEAEQVDELKKSTVKSYLIKKHDKMYTKPAKDPKQASKDLDNLNNAHARLVNVKPTSEEKDTPGNGYEHQCAVHVKHAKLGEGKTLFSQHAAPAEDGSIEWYDVMFAEGIIRVETKELEILVSESHMNHKKKK